MGTVSGLAKTNCLNFDWSYGAKKVAMRCYFCTGDTTKTQTFTMTAFATPVYSDLKVTGLNAVTVDNAGAGLHVLDSDKSSNALTVGTVSATTGPATLKRGMAG